MKPASFPSWRPTLAVTSWSTWYQGWQPRPGLWLALAFLAVLAVAALFPHWLVAADPLQASARNALLPPGPGHWLGTDENGRDILTRLVHGSRLSLLIGLAATLIGVVVGVLLGLLAGLGPKWLDSSLMRLIDMLLAFPDLLLALVIITFWGQDLLNLVIAIGIAGVPRYARLVRAQTFAIRRSLYVEAAQTLGLRRSVVILRHILPNAIKPVLLLAAIGAGGNIAAGAALSFLGFGAPPPTPEWGAMLAAGREFLANAWWVVAAPSLAITLTVMSITVVGRALILHSEGKQP